MKTFETTATRPRFIKQLSVAVAAGLGIAALMPQAAHAVNNCCPSTCGSCSHPLTVYYCDCSSASTESYCTTQCVHPQGCYNGPC